MDLTYITRPFRREEAEDISGEQEYHAPYLHDNCTHCETALVESIAEGAWQDQSEWLPALSDSSTKGQDADPFTVYRHFNPLYAYTSSPYARLFTPVALPGKRLGNNLRIGDLALVRGVLSGQTYQVLITGIDLLTHDDISGLLSNSRKPGYYVRAFGNLAGSSNETFYCRIADRYKRVLNNIIILRKLFSPVSSFESFDSILETGNGTAPDLTGRDTTPASETLYVNIDLGLRRECSRRDAQTHQCIRTLQHNVEPKTGIFIPANFNAQRQIDLLIYLHGHKSGYVSRDGHDLPIDQFWDVARMPKFGFREILNESGRNFILVAPTLGTLSQPGTLTSNDGFTRFVTQVISAISQHCRLYATQEPPTVRSIILAAHSGGGIPMRRIARLAGNNEFAGLIRECWGFDCTYNPDDPAEWHTWARLNPGKNLYLYSIAGTTPARNAGILQNRRPLLPNIHVLPSRTGDHNSVPRIYLRERLGAVNILTEDYVEASYEGCGCEAEAEIHETEAAEDIFSEDSPPPIAVTEQPMTLQNIPFARTPAAGSYWPLRTSNSTGRLVSYLTVNRTNRGREGRRFLARRDNRNYNGSVRRHIGTRQNRWHVGIDLFANAGDEVVACEAGRIIQLQFFYTASSGQRTYALLVEHAGCVVNYGEVTGDSLTRNNLREGDQVAAGQVIGYVSDTRMLHFETYALREDHRYHTLQWWAIPETPNPPAGLLNPTLYLLYLQENGQPLSAVSGRRVTTGSPAGTSRTETAEGYPTEALIEPGVWQEALAGQGNGHSAEGLHTEDVIPPGGTTSRRPAPRSTLTSYDALRDEYITLFDTCIVTAERIPSVDRMIRSILTHRARYLSAGQPLNIPWYFIAVIHKMESSLNFNTHLHNGDPLTARTVHVPAGRPAGGTPPFTWEFSAADALTMHRIDRVQTWDIARILFELERYNGWGYRLHHADVKSPYLWSFSNHYTRGKYVADGRWSATAVSQQAGGAVILKRMVDTGQLVIQ